MLARRIERAVKKEREILGDQRQFFVFLACWRSGENLQCGRQQPIKGTRVDSEAWGERVAAIGCHCREDRALNVTVAVEERVDLANPAECVR